MVTLPIWLALLIGILGLIGYIWISIITIKLDKQEKLLKLYKELIMVKDKLKDYIHLDDIDVFNELVETKEFLEITIKELEK